MASVAKMSQKISCPLNAKGLPDAATCFSNLIGTNPGLRAVDHLDQAHNLYFNTDYDSNGNNLTITPTQKAQLYTKN